MDIRLLPKLLLWGMLTLACLGTMSTLLRTETDPAIAFLQRTAEQQIAIQTAIGFTREWMYWNGEELPETRMQRLQPYVNPEALVRIAAIQSDPKTNGQQVVAVELISLSSQGSRFTIRIRVIALNPARSLWEVDVPVWVQAAKGAAITDPPLIRPLQGPPDVPESGSSEVAASSEVKERMRPAIERFLKVMCEGKDADSLFNYVTTGSKLMPLQGRLGFLSLDRLEVTGVGPYTATVTFSVQDEATGFRFTQVWRLAVAEENKKFFVGAVK